MERIINNKRYFLYSSLSRELKEVYHDRIYTFLGQLVFEYRGFYDWYYSLFTDNIELNAIREIILCEDFFRIAGVAIIKKDLNEKKICTLRVAKEFQNQGIGHNLFEMCMELLNTDKPMITLNKTRLHQFEKLLKYYNFELEQSQKHYYKIFSTELVYNGLLPQRKFIYNKMEMLKIEKIYDSFIFSTKRKFEDYINEWIRFWYNKEIRTRINIFQI